MLPVSSCSPIPLRVKISALVCCTGHSVFLSSGAYANKAKLSSALEQSIRLNWEDVYDFVNPFGDRRGGSFNSVWIFDLVKDQLFLVKKECSSSAPLQLARQRLLHLDDFEPLSLPRLPSLEEQALPEPYWTPKLNTSSRQRAFLGRVIRDFSHTWRHVFRRPMNTTTFLKLAYAIIWISKMELGIVERTGFEHISRGGPYVWLVGLPSWETPTTTLVKVGASWFVLAQDTRDGLEMVRRHMDNNSLKGRSTTSLTTYATLTLRCIVLCKASVSELKWTRTEKLFDNDVPVSDTTIDMILWAVNTTSTEPQPSAINCLPVGIQDVILLHSSGSLVASAKMGYELGLGSPFSWLDEGLEIGLEDVKRHRSEKSPVESQIFFNGVMSGLSYKRVRGYSQAKPVPPGLAPVWRPT